MMHPDAISTLVGSFDDLITRVTTWAGANQKCKRKAVGVTIIVANPNGESTLVTMERNGPSAENHECSGVIGNCGCAHAEPRAIFRAMKQGWLQRREVTITKLILLCQYSPCTNCANIINDSGIIQATVYREVTQHDPRGIELLKGNKVDCLLLLEAKSGAYNDIIGKWR